MSGQLDPAGAFALAVDWLQGTLLGTAIAVIAVAGLGFLLQKRQMVTGNHLDGQHFL